MGRRERHRAETRERLFEAALKLFAERGYLETTVEDITEAADVGKGTFFNYFPTKEHVLATLGAERVAAVERALEKAKVWSGASRAQRIGDGPRGPNLVDPRPASGHLRRSCVLCAGARGTAEEAHHRPALLTEILRLGQKSGEIRRDRSAAELARLTQTLLFGLTLAWALHPDVSLHETAEGAWDLFFCNLATGNKRADADTRSART